MVDWRWRKHRRKATGTDGRYNYHTDSYAATTPVGFEPSRAEPIGLASRRLNHSAKVS